MIKKLAEKNIVLKAAVISMGSISSKWVVDSLKRYFAQVDHIDIKQLEVNLGKEPEVLYEGKRLREYDCLYLKGSFRYADLLQSVTSILRDKCYMAVKASAFTNGHDKLLTHLKLQSENIPTPKTYLAATTEAARKILGKINFPIIMKFPRGTHGKGVMYADSYESASSMLDALSALRQPFLIQEYVETGGVDTRAIVVGEKVVAAMHRKALQGEKRANLHAGAKGEPAVLDNYTKKIAIQAAKAIGADICAVDILESAKGPVVIEVNLSPGLQGITEVTKINVADKIANFLFEQTLKTKETGKEKGSTKLMQELGIAESGKSQQLITNLDFRGTRILLPEVVTQIAKFDEKIECVINVKEGKLVVEKFSVGEEKKK